MRTSRRAQRIYRRAISKKARSDQEFRKNTTLAYRNQYVNMCLTQMRKPRSFHAQR